MGSKAAVLYHLRRLELLGLISRTKNSRGITLKELISFSRIPILGVANAGYPLAAAKEEALGEICLDNRIAKNSNNLFAVKVDGDSMNKQRIYNPGMSTYSTLENGSYAIVDKTANYGEGDVVLAVIDEAATIKVLKYSDNYILLMPNSTNPIHNPIYIMDNEELFINGKVIYSLENPNLSS
jgi:repressor LexA